MTTRSIFSFKMLCASALLATAGLAGGCASTQPQVVQLSSNGKQVSLQLSRDARSLLSRPPAKEAASATEELTSRKDLTDSLLASVAELQLLAGRTDEAALQARNLLKRDFKNTEALKTLVKVSIFNRRYAEALLIAGNALQVQPRDPDLLCLKGLAHYFLDEVFDARDSWKKALEVNPSHLTAQMNLAALYFHNRNFALAGAGFEKVLASQPQHLDARVGRALVLSVQGNHQEARTVLQDILSKNSRSPLALYNLAMLERDRFDNYEQALDYLDRYMAEAQKERANVERALVMREELRVLLAKKKSQKLSDAELRQVAAKSSQAQQSEDSARPVEVQNVATAATGKPQAAPVAKPAAPKAAPLPAKADDAQSLEEAIK